VVMSTFMQEMNVHNTIFCSYGSSQGLHPGYRMLDLSSMIDMNLQLPSLKRDYSLCVMSFSCCMFVEVVQNHPSDLQTYGNKCQKVQGGWMMGERDYFNI